MPIENKRSATQFANAAAHACGRLTRRDSLLVGGLAALGLGLSDVSYMQRAHGAALKNAKPAKSCILIWLDGGPSHLETFDLKPNAPAEVRGPFQPVSTSVPGIAICEHLPKTASLMKHIALIRSMTSPLGEHNFGTHYMLTGYKPTPVLEYPAFGSVLAHLRPGSGVLPPHIAAPSFRVGGGKLSGNGFLPAAARPFSVGGDPAKRDFEVRDLESFAGVTRSRLDRRRTYLNALNRLSERVESGSEEFTADADFEQAYRLVTSPQAREAFDLSQEPQATRRRYGGKTIGQSCLLARRLIERGVPFVTVNNVGWDTHENVYTRLLEGYTGAVAQGNKPVGLIPSFDLAFSALLGDLEDRGLLDETLVVVMGEFGRTPKLNTRGGRDHWPRVFSVALAGGGIAGGQVIGASDSVGETPHDRPITPSDLTATILAKLGIDPHHLIHTDDGRPVQVSHPESRIIEELL